MQLRRPSITGLSIAAACAAVFVIAGHFAASALVDELRSKQLRELNDVALRRLEVAIDYGASTLDELAHRGPVSCDPAALQAVRLHVYQHGAVKDIRVVGRDGQVRCSAYAETLEFDKGWASRSDMLPARDRALRIFRVDQFFGVALGVLMDIDDETSLVAILGISDSLFDIMPSDLRDHSDVLLELGDGQTVIQSPPLSPESSHPLIAAASISERYPLRTRIRIDGGALSNWNREPYVPIIVLAALLGLAFGILLGRAVARPGSPVVEIDKALAAGEFTPFLQPIFNLRTGAIVGCEALARWVRADGTVIPPSRFIQLAEASGRIERITWQILAAALNDLQFHLRRERTFKVSVNIVPRHLVAAGFIDELRRVVAAAKVSPHQVVLELTEREEFEDLSRAAAAVAQLRDLGFRVAIDDVGIGHSGLSHIQRLGANILKIDKFFVDSVCRDQAATAVIEMVVRLARELRMGVVAEGIEDQAQVAALVACGVEEGQGYLVSPPVPVDDFITLLAQPPRLVTDDRPDERIVADVA
jgi:sensor c-di-GMP phosphodiesterase-like protein